MLLSSLNKLCEIRDFRSRHRAAVLRELRPEIAQDRPAYPVGEEDRNSWEQAQLITGLERLRAVHREALVLTISPGTGPHQFALTRRARLVFAAGPFAGTPAASMLTAPESVTACPFERNRLIVQHMDPDDLRYEDETFHVVSALGVQGSLASIVSRLNRMASICRTGGIVMLTIDLAVAGIPSPGGPLTVQEVTTLISSCPGLVLADPRDWSAAEFLFNVRPLGWAAGHYRAASRITAEQDGCRSTSMSLFLRKEPVNG